MNKISVVRLGAALMALAASSAFAAPTNPAQATLNVSANILKACTVSLDSASMAFELDPTVTTEPAAVTVHASVACTKDTLATYSVIGYDTFLVGPGGVQLKYALTGTADQPITGQGMSTPSTVTLTGSILRADFINLAPGLYTKNLTINVAY